MRLTTIPSVRLEAGAATAQHTDMLQFEMASVCARSAPCLFASLAMNAFAQQQQQQQRPWAQVPVFSLARAAAAGVERFRLIKIKGDGRCMFRALAVGLARNQGRFLGGEAETQEADQLRLAVAEALCRTTERRNQFPQAVMAAQAEDNLANYCKRLVQPTFWGGEPELIVLAQMLKVPIFVYLKQQGKSSSGYVVIQKYGEKFSRPSGKLKKGRKPVRLVFVDGNHYDLLVQ